MNGYSLTRSFWEFSRDNQSKVKPYHSSVFMWAVEKCNINEWSKEFRFPTDEAMARTGIRSYKLYIRTLEELEKFGLLKIVERSKNQYTSNVIALVLEDKADTKALTKASTKADTNAHTKATPPIYKLYKQLNKETIKLLEDNIDFVKSNVYDWITDNTSDGSGVSFKDFWDEYHKTTGLPKTDKEAAKKYWKELSVKDKKLAIEKILPYYDSVSDKTYIRKARTYLDLKTFQDEFDKQTDLKDRVKVSKDKYCVNDNGITGQYRFLDSKGRVYWESQVEQINKSYYVKKGERIWT